MFTEVLFIIAQTRNNQKCGMCYCDMKYYPEKAKTTDIHNMDESQKHGAEGKNLDAKEYPLCKFYFNETVERQV